MGEPASIPGLHTLAELADVLRCGSTKTARRRLLDAMAADPGLRVIRHARETGVSGLYFPGTKCILLCEPCFLAEDDAIEDAGTNNLPERLSRYLRTLAEAAR